MKRVTKHAWGQRLAWALALVMLLALLPVGVLAEETPPVEGTPPAQDSQTADGTGSPAPDGTPEPVPDSTETPAPESTGSPDTEAASDPDVSAAPSPDDTAAPSPARQVQALIDALPDPESITAETRADVEAQLAAIDQAKLALGDEEKDELDIARYMAAAAALLALDGMAGADAPEAMAFPGDLSGTGIASDPYRIESAEQLAQLSQYVNGGQDCQDKHFKLMNDIDLGGGAWTPIGVSSSSEFKGTFDGGGHTVSGLSVTSGDKRGLFGRIGTGGTVKNLGVSGDIDGGSYEAGGVAGYSQGTITGCHSACTVHNGGYTGGIVGENRGRVEDCYNVGAVRGSDAGGIVGYNRPSGIVSNCYSTGPVSGSSAGGIVGRNNEGSVTNCYYLENTASTGVGSRYGSVTETSVESRSADQFRSLAKTLGGAWEDDPFLGRPVLKDSREPSPVAGEGTEDRPYLIPDKAALELVLDYVNRDSGHGKGKFFKLTKDIDLGGREEWTPIGKEYAAFNGTFDGGNFTVSGLYINDPAGENMGLFGYIGEDGVVKDLTVGGSVTGKSYVGGIAGRCEGAVTNCRNTAAVSGEDNVGGVVGNIPSGSGGKVTGCCNTGAVAGRRSVGGVVGDGGYGSQITNCYNTGAVIGDNNSVGGVVGDISNCSVSHCYNTGAVTSPSNTAKSVCGLAEGSTVTDCYYLDTTPADNYATPKTAGQFASGEVAWLLQKEQSSQVWGQTVGEGAPALTAGKDKTVYQLTGKVAGQADVVWYSNNKATLPAAPEKEGYTFTGWAKTPGGAAELTDGTPISGDMTVYAVFTEDPKGDLTVTVTDTGESADPAQQWHFRVELDDETLSGTYGDMLFTAGAAEFTLLSGQSLTARELPAGTAYTVTELNRDQDGYATTCTDDRGFITSEQVMVASFINDKPAPAQPDETPEPTDTPKPTGKPETAPATGDDTPAAPYAAALLLSLSGIVALALADKRRRRSAPGSRNS